MTTDNAALAALRALLPLAVVQTDRLRELAQTAVRCTPVPEVIAAFTERAEAATSAVTAARLALADAEAAAHHVSCHVRYRVTFDHVRPNTPGAPATRLHSLYLMAECAEDAQARAIEVCEAAGLTHGDVLRVERVTA